MYGKERMLLWTLVILAAGTLLAAVSSSLAVIVVARFIQGAAGGIFPLAFGIVRDEFPREKVAGSIGLLSAILGVGAGVGIVLAGRDHRAPQLPLAVLDPARRDSCSPRSRPGASSRSRRCALPGRINWLAAALMTIGISTVLLAISETTSWGWGSAKTIGLLAVGIAVSCAWIAVEVRSENRLIDMTMMRIRGVWTTNLAAFLLGAGMYASFIVIPQFAQLPKSTGFGFGASVVVSGPVPAAVDDRDDDPRPLRRAHLGPLRLALARCSSGTAFTTASFALLAVAHSHPYDLLIAAGAARASAWASRSRRSAT